MFINMLKIVNVDMGYLGFLMKSWYIIFMAAMFVSYCTYSAME